MRFVITSHQVWLSLITLTLIVMNKYLWHSETCYVKIIFDVLNVEIKYFCNLEKFNAVKNYIWWVPIVKIIISEVLWYKIYLYLLPKINNTYLSRNLMYEIDIFYVHNFLTLIIITFRVDTITNDYFWRPSLLSF